MSSRAVNIPARILAGLRRQAAAAAPAECCGGLIGVGNEQLVEVRTLIPVDNESSAPAQYHIDAETVLRLERQASCAGLHLVGFYHSHPTQSAAPSALDLELACPGYIYLIVQSDPGIVRGWRLRDDRSGFGELHVTAVAGAA